MKNFLKITALSLGLFASIFLLSNTKTNAGLVSLEITGTSGHCVVGSAVPFGVTGFSYAAYSMETGFLNASGSTTWYCDDTAGEATRLVDVQTTDVANITTNNPLHTIPAATRVRISANSGALVSGVCGVNVGSSNGAYLNTSSAIVLFGKSTGIGEVCKVEAQNVKMKLDLEASQALGQYSGTITVTIPTWAM